MRGNKKLTTYLPEALEHLGKCLLMIRKKGSSFTNNLGVQLKLDGLEAAIRNLDEIDRERIERFWGLKGGPNHSKKLGHHNAKDVAYKEMSTLAVLSLEKLLTLENAIMYDPTISRRIDLVAKKVDISEIEISDIECVKYLMAFLIYADNGPKMSFETDPLSIDTDLKDNFLFDEYEVLYQMCEEFSRYPDNCINIKLLIGFFEMLDVKDSLAIKKSMGILVPKDSLPEGVTLEEIERVRTVSLIRELKERIFPYGPWDVVTSLILSNGKNPVSLDEFMVELDSIRRDWGKIAEFKVGERTLKTGSELRTLNVYKIGGLEFTDIYEVMVIYLLRNLIVSDF